VIDPRNLRVKPIFAPWLRRDRRDWAKRQRRKKKCRLADEVPLGRMGRVEEFGKTVAWLASPAASFIHGHALMFDGGAVRSAL